MPKRDTTLRLPAVHGANGGTGSKDRHVVFGPASLGGDDHGFSSAAPLSELSTAPVMSIEDARALSSLLDDSIEMPLDFNAARERGGNASFEVQTPEQIIQEVKRCVQERRPGRVELDDEALEKRRQHERQDRMDHGSLIILPDNRVCAMEDQLSRRVRALLLEEEELPEPAAPAALVRRKGDASAPKARSKPQNPWYLPAKSWYGKGADVKESAACAAKASSAEDGIHCLSQKDKESLDIVIEYKKHLAHIRARLPQCLM